MQPQRPNGLEDRGTPALAKKPCRVPNSCTAVLTAASLPASVLTSAATVVTAAPPLHHQRPVPPPPPCTAESEYQKNLAGTRTSHQVNLLHSHSYFKTCLTEATGDGHDPRSWDEQRTRYERTDEKNRNDENNQRMCVP